MTLPAFDPALPVPVIATAAGIAAVFTLYRAFAGQPIRPAWLQLPVVGLRLVVIALLAVLLLNPSTRVTREKPKTSSVILLDRSASMRLATGGGKTRWTEARAWVEEARKAIADQGGAVPPVAVFNEELESLADSEALAGIGPAGKETHLASAVAGVLERGGKESPRQIIVVSDGRAHDLGDLPRALAAARDLDARISTKLIGTDTPPRNSWIAAVEAPRAARPKGKISVRVELASTGISSHEMMTVVVNEKGGKEVARTHFPPRDSGSETVEKTLVFEIGLRTTSYTLQLLPAADEVDLEDNHFGFTVEVSASKLRVLLVEGTHEKRSVGNSGHFYNDMELMTRAWDDSGEIEYECLTPVSQNANTPSLVGVTFKNGEMRPDPSRSFPATREDIYRFDVIIISDTPIGNFSNDQMQWVLDWVTERGGGFLMCGGYSTFDVGNYDRSVWEKIIPVDTLSYGAGFMEKQFPIRIPDAVRNHPLWRISEDPEENAKALAAHPVFRGMNRVKRAKPGAVVLAVRADAEGDEPVIAAQSYGRGRSIAWLPDPNGGWGREYVKWGPPGSGPRITSFVQLGHGSKFRLDEAAANSAVGPVPPHPSGWYAQYWVNLVKWLGEPSIRWHRDKLAGRSQVASAKPGQMLPVAAEVLAVTNLDELLSLDVGARLDVPGTPRVRLEYDRDAREFVGELPVPPSAEGDQVNVYFDAAADGTGFTDIVPVSLRRSHLEFTETAPNAAFMTELAGVAAGRVLDSPGDAASWLAEVAEAEAKQSAAAWNQPLWPRWPLLGTIIGLLCLEWLIRRRAMLPAAAVTAVFLLLPTLSRGQEPARIDELVSQLGSPKVRERDEAEDALKTMPAAMEAVRRAMESHPSAEGRLRAAATLRGIRQELWVLEKELPAHTTSNTGFAVLAAPDGRHFYTRGDDDAMIWDATTLEARPIGADRLGRATGNARIWPTNTFAISPDSKRLVTGSDVGAFKVHDAETGAVIHTLVPETPELPSMVFAVPTSDAAFSPDGKQLSTTGHSGHVFHWDLETGKMLSMEKLPAPPQRLVFSPDSRYLAFSILRPGIPDVIWIQRVEDRAWTTQITTSNPVNGIAFSPDGKWLAAATWDGSFNLYSVQDGVLGPERVIFRGGNSGRSVLFSKDSKTLFVSSTNLADGLQQVDLESGEVIWKAPQTLAGCLRMDFLGDDRLLTAYGNGVVRIWRMRR